MRAVRVRSAGAEDRLSPALRSMLWCAVPREACSPGVRIGCVPGRFGGVSVCVNIGRLNERGSESAAFIVVSARKKTLRAILYPEPCMDRTKAP